MSKKKLYVKTPEMILTEATESDIQEAGYCKREEVEAVFCKRGRPLLDNYIDGYECYKCKEWLLPKLPFCPSCGSKLNWKEK